MKRLLLFIITAVAFFAAGELKAQLVAKPDSIVISVFVKDSLGNPANLAADTFAVCILGPRGDSILAVSGPPSTADLNIDSLTQKTLGKVYHYAKKLDDIDGTPSPGLYEIRLCAKKNSPLLVTCETRTFQLVDSTANAIIKGIMEAVDSLRSSATLSDVVKEIQRRSASYGNLLQNPSFEDTVTSGAYNFWTFTATGGATANFSSLVSTYGSIGYYSARLLVNTGGDIAYARSRPIRLVDGGAYEYGGYFDQGSLAAGDSTTIGIVTNNTLTFSDSVCLGALTAGTIDWYKVTRKTWLPTGTYQFVFKNTGTGHIQVCYLDDAFFRRISTDSTTAIVWSAAQRDTVINRIRRVLDSLTIQITNWTTANRDTLLSRGLAALDSLGHLIDSLNGSMNMLTNIGLYNGSLYDTTGVILYPLGIAPKDSARVYEVTAAMAVWTYRGSFYYRNVGVTTRTTNVTDTIIFKKD
jgi:hypothetical protein